MNKILLWVLIGLGVIIGAVTAGYLVYEHAYNSMIDRKPAVYLYPLENSFIDVRLEINGKMIEDVPEYDDGWNVFVTKEGLIDGKYDYLFYEARLRTIEIPDEGWIVPYEDLENWFDKNLISLGLNDKEKNQFKEYWLEELPKSEYYDIRLLEDSFLERNMNLVINPQPDTLIRLNFYFKPLKEKTVIKEPVIFTPERSGFVVIEWGGIIHD